MLFPVNGRVLDILFRSTVAMGMGVFDFETVLDIDFIQLRLRVALRRSRSAPARLSVLGCDSRIVRVCEGPDVQV